MTRQKTIYWIAAGILAAFIGIFFRLYPVTVYPRYAAQNKSELILYSAIRKTAETKVRGYYFNESVETQNRIINKHFKDFLKKERKKIKNLLRAGVKQNLNEPEKKTRYLLEADPYYYLKLTQNLLETGRMAEKTKGHKYFNSFMMAPAGHWYPLDYHPYAGAALHRFLHLFNKDITLMESVGLTPLVLTCLCLLIFLLILSKIFNMPPLASFISAVFFILTPMFLRRSLIGWYDTDPYNILFPLLILFFLFLFLKNKGSLKARSLPLLSAVLVTAAYSLFWRGFFLVFSAIALSFLGAAVLSLFKKGPAPEKKIFLGFSVLYALSPVIFFPLLWGREGLQEILKEASTFGSNFFHPSFSLWPDIFLSIGELRPTTFLSMTNLVGNPAFYLFSALAILAGIFFPPKDETSPPRSSLLLLLGVFIITTCLARDFERFCVLLVVPVSLGFAIGLKRSFDLLSKAPVKISYLLKGSLSILLLIGIFTQAHRTIRFDHAIYNSSWDKAMQILKTQTPKDSIVTSWWSPGHFITTMADRRVTFDGATQETHRAYWVSNLFLSNSEERSLNILRMLNSGADLKDDPAKKTGRLSARIKALWNTKFEVPKTPSYIFLYDDMLTNAMVLEYIGNWDFEKAEAFETLVKKYPRLVPKGALKRASPENVKLAWSIAGGPWAQNPEEYEQGRSGPYVFFLNGLKIHQDLSEAELNGSTFGSGRIESLFYMDRGVFKEKKLDSPNIRISALIIQEKNQNGGITYRSVVADKRLIQSLLFRLYYLKGEGLDHFQLIGTEESVENRNKFYIYKVNFD